MKLTELGNEFLKPVSILLQKAGGSVCYPPSIVSDCESGGLAFVYFENILACEILDKFFDC